jgi:hypothetical protein
MSRTLVTLAALLAAPVLACSCSQKAESAPGSAAVTAAPHKVQAPVTIDAAIGPGTARITLRFAAPATDVRVKVHGVDGLVVTSAPTLAEGATFTAGEEAGFDVAFTPGAGRSHLAVVVDGHFSGAHRAQVVTFAIGNPTAVVKKASAATTEGAGGEEGERVKVLPGRKP